MKARQVKKSTALTVSLVGIMAATVECGKLALSFLPNIEVVTLLIALYSYVFGWLGVLAALIFVIIEPLIYGFGSWVIAYFIHWPAVAIIFLLLGRARIKNRIVLTSVAVLLTVLFGVLTSLVEIGLFSGFFENFFYRFGIYYMRGIPFYAAQTVTNAVLFPTLFPLLSAKLGEVKRKIGL